VKAQKSNRLRNTLFMHYITSLPIFILKYNA
jgi:hypothetical protein